MLAKTLLTRNRAETLTNRAKPWPYSTVARPMEPRVFCRFKLTAPWNNRSNGFWLNAHGAVRFRWHSYGGIRCGFKKSGILRSGSVRFSGIGNPTVRFGAVMYPTARFGAVRCGFQMSWTLRCGSIIFYILRCGSVRFSDIVKPTVRCGAVFKRAKILRCGAVRCGQPHRTDRKNRTVKNPEYIGHQRWIMPDSINIVTHSYTDVSQCVTFRRLHIDYISTILGVWCTYCMHRSLLRILRKSCLGAAVRGVVRFAS